MSEAVEREPDPARVEHIRRKLAEAGIDFPKSHNGWQLANVLHYDGTPVYCVVSLVLSDGCDFGEGGNDRHMIELEVTAPGRRTGFKYFGPGDVDGLIERLRRLAK
jgi:hypothetical protein